MSHGVIHIFVKFKKRFYAEKLLFFDFFLMFSDQNEPLIRPKRSLLDTSVGNLKFSV